MKKHLFCITLLAASLLTACGSKNQEVETYYYDIEDIVLSSEGSTEADRQRQFQIYLENYIKDNLLEPIPEIKSASVTLQSLTDSETIIISDKDDEEISVAVMLELEDELSTVSTTELADYLATAVGNTSTDEIIIMDVDGNLLFPE